MESKTENDSLLSDWPVESASEDLSVVPKVRRSRSCCYKCCCSKTFLFIGFILSLTLALVIHFTPYFEETINVVVISQIPLKEGSDRAEMWTSGFPPLTYRMYLFNLTNLDDFRRGARPIVDEVGPFTYDVTETRENVVYDGTVVSFQAKPLFRFRPDLSVPGGEDLMIYTLNVPLVNAGDMAKTKPKSVAFRIFREVFAFESIRKLTAGQILWGHNSRLLNVAKTLTDLPYPYDYFALLAGRNNTLQPLTSMNIGIEDITMMNQILSYDGPGPKTGCNSVSGTDGSAFGPNVNESSILFVYNGQFCRSLPLVYNNTFETHGIRTMRFMLPEDVFSYSEESMSGKRRPGFGNSRYRNHRARQSARRQMERTKSENEDATVPESTGPQRSNRTRNQNSDNPFIQSREHKQISEVVPTRSKRDDHQEPETSWKSFYGGSNKCFCVDQKCLPDGVLDMKPCLLGAPVGFSFPHFLNGDPRLRHVVRGLRPDPSLHSTEFDIFPDLGVPLRVKLRMQMNVVLDQNQALNRARHFDMIYPIFWFEAGIDSLPVSLVGQLQMAQDLPPLMKQIFVVICGVLSIVFFVLLMAQSFIGWCSGGLSSIMGKGGRSSETITTVPETEPQLRESLNPDVRFPDSGAYKSFASPQLISGDGPNKLIDTHTLLPPYKKSDPVDRESTDVVEGGDFSDVPRKRKLVGTNSDSGVASKFHEPDESNNYYPPDYHAVTSSAPVDRSSSSRSNSSVVSAEVEFHRTGSYLDLGAPRNASAQPIQTNEFSMPGDIPTINVDESLVEPSSIGPTSNLTSSSIGPTSSSSIEPITSTPYANLNPRLMSLKPLPAVPRVIDESLKRNPAVVSAPLASPEYDEVPIEDDIISANTSGCVYANPLATSSPHATLDNIHPPTTQSHPPTTQSHSPTTQIHPPTTQIDLPTTQIHPPTTQLEDRQNSSTNVSRLSATSAPENYYIAPPLESDL